MTYNFDPDRWYQIRLARLEERRASGEIDDEKYAALLAELELRLEEMLRRLDGTYQIPHSTGSD